MKTILIPTDFSENSWNAIQYAVGLFKEEYCTFYILHIDRIARSGVGSNSFTSPTEPLVAPAKKRLPELLLRIRLLTKNKKHHFIALQEYGSMIKIIRNTVVQKRVDLIVMGTTGASGLKASIVGSNTGDVITKVACNVLVIPEKAAITTPAEIIFPTDFNIFYTHNILEGVSEILQVTKASLRILNVTKMDEHLTEDQEDNQEYLFDYLCETFPHYHSFHSLTNGNVVKAIQNFVETNEVDLIVMVAKNLNFLQKILFNTSIEKVSFQTKTPLLVLHE